MSTAIVTLADMLHELGDVPPQRIRRKPYRGTATAKDLLRITAKEDVLLELVDGILVEKARGCQASRVAMALAFFLELYLAKQDLGVTSGPDGMIRLDGGLIKAPDLAFFPWRLFPKKDLPSEPIPDLVPELIVEVLSESNTPGEMARKYQEYFDAGVRLIWEVDPDVRKVRILTGPDEVQQIEEARPLTGGGVLAGFRLPLKQVFQRRLEAADPRTSSSGPRRQTLKTLAALSLRRGDRKNSLDSSHATIAPAEGRPRSTVSCQFASASTVSVASVAWSSAPWSSRACSASTSKSSR